MGCRQLDAIHDHATAVGALETIDATHQCRFPRAGRPTNHHTATALDLEIHIAKRLKTAEILVEMLDRNHQVNQTSAGCRRQANRRTSRSAPCSHLTRADSRHDPRAVLSILVLVFGGQPGVAGIVYFLMGPLHAFMGFHNARRAEMIKEHLEV